MMMQALCMSECACTKRITEPSRNCAETATAYITLSVCLARTVYDYLYALCQLSDLFFLTLGQLMND